MRCSPPIFVKDLLRKSKNSKKTFRSLSQPKQEKKSRLKSDFSNLVKNIIPGLRHNIGSSSVYNLTYDVSLVCDAPLGHYSLPTSHPGHIFVIIRPPAQKISQRIIENDRNIQKKECFLSDGQLYSHINGKTR